MRRRSLEAFALIPPRPPETFTNSGGLAFSDRSYKGGKALYTHLYIIFRDELGRSMVEVDENGITCTDGKAYFSDGKRDYIIPVESVCEINLY